MLVFGSERSKIPQIRFKCYIRNVVLKMPRGAAPVMLNIELEMILYCILAVATFFIAFFSAVIRNNQAVMKDHTEKQHV